MPVIAAAPPTPPSGPGGIELVAVLLSLTALFAYLNHRLVRLPPGLGVMLLATAFSLAVLVAGLLVPGLGPVTEAARRWAFGPTVLHALLGLLLFAAALHTNLETLASRWQLIAVLAVVGVLLTTGIVGVVTYTVLNAIGLNAPLVYCFLFGALISPTDPIAVQSVLKSLAAPESLEATATGESVFNDGFSVVVFLGLLHAIEPARAATGGPGLVFVREGLGGILFGLALGVLFYYLLRSVDDHRVELLLSVALVAGGYVLAGLLLVSAPVAMLVAGLLLGNHGRLFAMSDTAREHLDTFWGLIDEVLNAVLIMLLALEVLALTLTGRHLLAGVVMVPIVLFARLAAVAVPVALVRLGTPVERYTTRLLWWGGLRGGLSVVMALSLPAVAAGGQSPPREWVLIATYAVVAFSVLVQGPSLGPLLRRWLRPAGGDTATA